MSIAVPWHPGVVATPGFINGGNDRFRHLFSCGRVHEDGCAVLACFAIRQVADEQRIVLSGFCFEGTLRNGSILRDRFTIPTEHVDSDSDRTSAAAIANTGAEDPEGIRPREIQV